jgi:type I restriction enzyme S subunit
VLRIPNLKGGGVDTTDLKFGILDEREKEKLRLELGDLLIIRSNGSASLVGSAALVGTESEGFAFAGYLVRARFKREYVEPTYLVLLMQTLEIRSQIEAPIRTTSGVKNINSTEISRLAFPLPPLAEQSRIVTRVAQLRRLCADLRQRLSASQSTQAHLAEALVENVA